MSSEEKAEVHHPAGDDNTDEHLGPRVRKLTEKGLKYALETKLKRLHQLCRSLEKISDYVLELMDTDVDHSGIQKGYKQWISLFDEFLTVNDDYQNLLSPDEVREHEQDWYEARFQAFTEFKAKTENWFAKGSMEDLLHTKHREIEEPDRISVMTTSTYSSRHSAKSNSTVKSARLLQQQRKAELEIQLTSLNKRRQLEQEKLRLHIEEEELKLQEKLAISEAHCKALDDIDHKSVFKGSSRASSASNDSTALMAVIRHLNKPTSEIKKFGGNPLEYHRFVRQFQSRVVSNCDSFDEKLNFLEQYTFGDASKVVSGYSQMKDATKAYQWALQALEERYGDSDVVVNAYIQKALQWPVIKPDNPRSLDEFAIFLLECEHAVQNVESIRVLEYTDNFKRIVSKLPYNMHDKWRSLVQDKKDRGIRPSFSHLVKFVSKEAKKVNDPTFGKEAMKFDQDKYAPKQCSSRVQRSQKGTFATKLTDVEADPSSKPSAFVSPCLYCKGPHALKLCRHLFDLPYYDRTDILKSKGCCFGCLRYGHQRKFCKNKAICTHCQGRHPSVLHVNGKFPVRGMVGTVADSDGSVKVNTVSGACADMSCMYNNPDNIECTMAIIPVKVRISGSKMAVTTYAFLDPGSNVSFCTDKLMFQLGIQGKRMKLNMDTMGVPHSMYSFELKGLEIIDLDENNSVPLPPIYTKDEMPVSRCHIPTSEDLQQWRHLQDIKLPHINAEVGLLIGNNIPDASTPLEVRVGPRGTPYATRSVLGWIPWNIIRTGIGSVHTVNRADVVAIEQLHELKDLNKLYVQSVNLDFPERSIDDRKEPSPEDSQFLTKMHKSQKIVKGHYELCLPFRDDKPSLPDNKFLAVQRLRTLRKKMLSNQRFSDDYQSFMQTLLDKGYAERVPGSELIRTDGKTWYLPHHGIYNPNKPNKIRVVFDCSAKCKGISLNDKLLQGPDLTNRLIGVLLKFRQDAVAIQGDIEKMFYQVKVAQDDRDCLRYFWWPNGELHTDPVIYRMTVHIFGAVSSPSCANFALQQAVQAHREKFDPCIGQFAVTHFYVDDFLCSVPTEEEAMELIEGLSSLCQMGGFHITKWLVNSRAVLEGIPEHDRAKDIASLDFDNFPTERALGVSWNVEIDSIVFNIVPRACDASRRNILSVISSLYDPLGLVSPFVLPAKLLLQDLCRREVAWDTILKDVDLHRWNQWLEDLPKFADVIIPRCLKSPALGNIIQIQLHHFSDASDNGYGTVSYIRFLTDSGHIHCSLLFGKSRVAPLKRVTIPRLELTAAALIVKFDKMITTELQYSVDDTYFWTDSMAVIRYIANQSTRYKTFVANRLSIIREATDICQWRFVDGILNPADFASRGLRIDDLSKTKIWFDGPAFLWKPYSEWPRNPDADLSISSEDPEVKNSSNAVIVEEPLLLDELSSRFSSWMKLKRTLGWILLFINGLSARVQQRTTSTTAGVNNVDNKRVTRQQTRHLSKRNQDDSFPCIPIAMLQKAENVLIRHVQHQSFPQEIADLSQPKENESHVKRSSPLYRLDPYLHEGIIRVGGRLQRSFLSFDAKHQILLPQKSCVSRLILQDIHQAIGHQGKNAVVAELRQRYWIPRAAQIIKQIVSKCVSCRRYRAQPEEQKMADLPKDRIVPGKPFSDVGIDYFGPFIIKRGRIEVKRYGVIFSCCKSRAVHLEIAWSLTTDSCINAIRRFVARRGPVDCIRSDNGTNLVGAEQEMRKEIQLWNQSKVGRALQQHNIEWKFNPPAGSHFGGFWERLIRSVRKIIYSLLRDQSIHLDDEGLQTLMCEVEGILNNRPLTSASDDPNDLETLSPSHILMMKSGASMPPGVFDVQDNYTRRRWRQLQYLSSLFWTRWSREYLPLLQKRQKWLRPKRNVAVGDIVLITDSSPRNVWPMARVTELHHDNKGLVRVVTLKTKSTTLTRPVDKLCLLLEADD